VLEALAEMKSDLYAMLASTLRLSTLVNRLDLGAASEQERAVHRLLVNINKYATSVQASLGIRRAQEIMGGNGAIEDFSAVPRLYRDAVVFESWEGSHNVLCLQAARDMQRYGLHQQLLAYLGGLLDGVTRPELAGPQDLIVGQMEHGQRRLEQVLRGSPEFHQTHVRRVIDQLALLVQAACLLAEADWELSQGLDTDKPAALASSSTATCGQAMSRWRTGPIWTGWRSWSKRYNAKVRTRADSAVQAASGLGQETGPSSLASTNLPIYQSPLLQRRQPPVLAAAFGCPTGDVTAFVGHFPPAVAVGLDRTFDDAQLDLIRHLVLHARAGAWVDSHR
jgi:hypothetical protein